MPALALSLAIDDVLRPRVLFVCGSLNQTTQMQAIARELPECEAAFAPYWVDGGLELLRRLGWLESTIAGRKLVQRCRAYLQREGLPIAERGCGGPYDLIVSCSDLVVQRRLRGQRVVLVQEGILDPPSWGLKLWRRFRALPRWLGGTATTGLSLAYERFCVASEGYRDHFRALGVPDERLVVTGIPNFDDCRRYLENEVGDRGYVLVCTSDARETWKPDDREGFIRWARAIAGERRLVFKLHPNERQDRAVREIRAWAPGARIVTLGSAEELIANCAALVTQYSSTVFVGLALGKEVHSYHERQTLERLLPIQNGCAAREIASVCRKVLAAAHSESAERGRAQPVFAGAA